MTGLSAAVRRHRMNSSSLRTLADWDSRNGCTRGVSGCGAAPTGWVQHLGGSRGSFLHRRRIRFCAAQLAQLGQTPARTSAHTVVTVPRLGTNGVAGGAPAASSVRSRNNSRSASAFSPEPQVSGHQVTGSATTAGDRLVIDGAGEAWSLRPSFLAIKSSAFPRKPNPSYRECRNHLCYPSRVMHSCSTERISDDPDGVNAPERFTPARKVSENGNLCASCRCEIGTPGVGLGVEGASIFLKAPFAEAGLVKPSAPPLTSYIRRSSTMAQESE